MLESFLEDYINDLYNKQNEGAGKDQKDLFSKNDYYTLLKPVIDCVSKHKDHSLEELREMLFKQSGIEERIQEIIYKKEMVPGLVFSYGTDNYKETIVIGNRQEVAIDGNGNVVPAVEKMTEDTIFDLASITKLFTSLSILKLVENGSISLNDEVTKYAPEFKNLDGVTIFDLISFRLSLLTNGRIDDKANDKDKAEQILFDIHVNKESENKNPYTDMGAMVLKYIIEHVSGMTLYQFVDENILKPLNMKDTHVLVPKPKLYRVASTNLDCKFYNPKYDDNGNMISKGDYIITNHENGIVYDAKARIMGQPEGVLSGHAGMFSTASDMTTLAKGIMGGQIIDDEYVEMMAKNRTGRKYIEDDKVKYVQYLGFLCYSKNPYLSSSEVYHALSGRTFASAGWTGTQLTVDPINQIYFFLAGNRSHNRMTFIGSEHKGEIMEDNFGKKTILLPNGETKIDATRFAWDRDTEIVHPALRLTIQYKMLEDIFKLTNEKIEQEENVRSI